MEKYLYNPIYIQLFVTRKTMKSSLKTDRINAPLQLGAKAHLHFKDNNFICFCILIMN